MRLDVNIRQLRNVDVRSSKSMLKYSNKIDYYSQSDPIRCRGHISFGAITIKCNYNLTLTARNGYPSLSMTCHKTVDPKKII